jgi:hypothetical protein
MTKGRVVNGRGPLARERTVVKGQGGCRGRGDLSISLFSEIKKSQPLRMTAFVEGVENIWLRVQKHGKIEKVAGSKRSETAP